MTSDVKLVLGIVAALLSIAAHIPYILTLLRGTNRPHMFTWVLWSILSTLGAAAQIAGGAGPGAWSTSVTALLTILIMCLTFTRGEKTITRTDWAMFVGGLSAIPVWIATSDPFWAALIVVAIDALAFGPTFRKSWHAPQFENLTMYWVNVIRHGIAIAALSTYTFVTLGLPFMLFVMNGAMMVMLILRRRKLSAAPGR